MTECFLLAWKFQSKGKFDLSRPFKLSQAQALAISRKAVVIMRSVLQEATALTDHVICCQFYKIKFLPRGGRSELINLGSIKTSSNILRNAI